MECRTRTPSIEVSIGRERRLYHAYITTAPATLDAPATPALLAPVFGYPRRLPCPAPTKSGQPQPSAQIQETTRSSLRKTPLDSSRSRCRGSTSTCGRRPRTVCPL